MSKVLLLQDQKSYLKQARSVYEQYVLSRESSVPEEKELFLAFVELPDLWEVQANGPDRDIIDAGEKKGSIFSKDGTVSRVEWQDKEGKVFRMDYYSVFGHPYSSLFLDKEEHPMFKSFYTSAKEEIINVNYSNGTVLVFQNGTVKEIFHSTEEFEQYAFSFIIGQPESYWKKWQLPLVKEVKAEVLILTATELVYGIETLCDCLPEVTFHIAAHTMMSTKLTDLVSKGNVKLYPCVTGEELAELYKNCSLYLDINHGKEIYDAVTTCCINRLLILGFKDFLHKEELVLPECIFESGEEEKLAEKIRQLLQNSKELEKLLEKQRRKVIAR